MYRCKIAVDPMELLLKGGESLLQDLNDHQGRV